MAWWIWLLIAIVLGIIEVSSVTFVLLWIAIAALLTAFITPVIANAWVQLAVFVVVSVVLYLVTRPLARKWRTKGDHYPTRQETMVNQTGVVVSGSRPDALSTVRIHGELWSAEAPGELLEGEEVVVKSVTAAVLKVEPVRRNVL